MEEEPVLLRTLHIRDGYWAPFFDFLMTGIDIQVADENSSLLLLPHKEENP